MNTNSLKRFATTARNILLSGVRNRLQAVGFNKDGSVREMPEAVAGGTLFGGELITDPHFTTRWNALRQRIESHGVKEVVEEAAYTWFNRFLAIRILVRNGLAQPVLDYENSDVRLPRIVTDARAGKTPILTVEDRAALDRVISDGRLAFEQFSILIRTYCENSPILRSCFGGLTDYTSLLLPADILAPDNFIDLLNDADTFISPEDYAKPELIGWLYQFYISEKKDEVFAKKGGYDSDEIPAATQIFTPNWIVKYMVENTLGRIYLDNHPDDHFFSEKWKYLVSLAEPTPQEAIFHYDALEELTCADLSCGSGHILNEMFDLLMQLYEDDFYSPREAIEAIFTKNMVGIDLDIRARQLSQFALLLKACQRDSAFADGHCLPRIYSFPDVDRYTWLDLNGHFNCAYQLEFPNNEAITQIKDAFELLEDADTLGSIMKFEICSEGREYLCCAVSAYDAEPKHTDKFASLVDAFRIILALTDKYAAICMNPPYMGRNGMNDILTRYIISSYPMSKWDLFAIFMEVASARLKSFGKYGMINMHSWMFLSSFEELRQSVIRNYQIDSLLHLGPNTFDELSGEVVQNVAFIITNIKPCFIGKYARLVKAGDCSAKSELFYNDDVWYNTSQKSFSIIPGTPIAYWLNDKWFSLFGKETINDFADSKAGIVSGNDPYFVRFWHEVNHKDISLEAQMPYAKYHLFQKGGTNRRYYGNNEYVFKLKDFWNPDFYNVSIRRGDTDAYFKECIGWSYTGSTDSKAFRYVVNNVCGTATPTLLVSDHIDTMYLLGFANTKIVSSLLPILNPTLSLPPGYVVKLPIIEGNKLKIAELVEECVTISKEDWDAHEISWDFETSPLLAVDTQIYLDNIEWRIECHRRETGEEICLDPAPPELGSLKWRFDQYCQKWECLFDRLHRNEEEINRKFIDIYGLQDELTPDVALEDVTILQQGEIKIRNKEEGYVISIENSNLQIPVSLPKRIEWQRDVIIKQFISYAIGCMMGRYRLDRPGLAIAHLNPSAEEIAPYTVPQTGIEWWIDDDGIVPMMGENSGFHDNAVNRFDKFIEVALGPDYKTDNLNFVREALGKDIVDYLRNDFYADHKKMYQNRPIYWMFSSNQKGKRAAFQCLVYMHRMNRFTPEHIRTNYLLPYIETLAARETELSLRPSLSAKENKELKQLRADLEECRDYQLRLHEFADQQIEIDLDDGVAKNYATFAPVLAKLK